MDDKLLQLVGLIPGVIFAKLLAAPIEERIRRYRAQVCLIAGLVGIALALIGYFIVFQLLPSLRPTDPSLAFYTLEFGFICFFTGLLVFSLAQIARGSIRLLNGRRPSHRN